MEKPWLRLSSLTIKEKDGEYMIGKDQLLTILRQYRELMVLLKRLLDERQVMEFLLDEKRLKKLGVSQNDGYLN